MDEGARGVGVWRPFAWVVSGEWCACRGRGALYLLASEQVRTSCLCDCDRGGAYVLNRGHEMCVQHVNKCA